MEAPTSPSTLNPLAPPFTTMRSATDNDAPLPPPPAAIDPATERLFQNLSTYPFDSDGEFQSGLSAILGHPERRASPEEIEQNGDLMLKAQCFYFARQNNIRPIAIDSESYKAWLLRRSREPSAGGGADTNDTHPADGKATMPSQQEHQPVPSTSSHAFSTPVSIVPGPALPPSSSHTELLSHNTESQQTELEPIQPHPSSSQPQTLANLDPSQQRRLSQHLSSTAQQLLFTSSSQSQPPTTSLSPLPADPPPPLPSPSYPTTFNHIVDLITRNQPIPGIETIPNIVLGTANSAPNTVPARRKPWETSHDPPKDDSAKASTNDGSTKDSTEKSDDSVKPLFGGLLGPLTRTEESSAVKPVPVQTTTPSWQELAEQGATDQVAYGGDVPAAHEA